MRKILFLAFLLPMVIWSCQTDTTQGLQGTGTITVTGAQSVELQPNVFTRADADAQQFTLMVVDEATQTTVINGLLSSFPGGVVDNIPAGTYTVRLTSHPGGFSPAFNDAMYEAVRTGIAVTPESNTLIELEATQANAGVYFVYDESLYTLGGFDAVIPTINQGAAALVYDGANHESWGYFHPEDAVLTLSDGTKTLTLAGENSQVLELDREQLWEITLKVSGTGTGNSITIDASVKVITDPTDFREFEIGTGGGSPAIPDNDGYLLLGVGELSSTAVTVNAFVDPGKAPSGIDYLKLGVFEAETINNWLAQGRNLPEFMEIEENGEDMSDPMILFFVNLFGAEIELEDLEPGREYFVISYTDNGTSTRKTNYVNFTTRLNDDAPVAEGAYTWNWYLNFNDDFTGYSSPEPITLNLAWLSENDFVFKGFWGVSSINLRAKYDESASMLTLSGFSDLGFQYFNNPEGLKMTEPDGTELSAGFYIWDENKNQVNDFTFVIEDGRIVSSKQHMTIDGYVYGSLGLPEDFLYHYALAPLGQQIYRYGPDSYSVNPAGVNAVSAARSEPYKLQLSSKNLSK